MANYFLCLVIFRIALPILLSICILFRPSGLSALYMLLLFYLPLVPVPTLRSMTGHTGIYLKILIAISLITSLCQIAFQIVLFATGPYGSILKDCELLEKALRHAGFVKLDAVDAITVTTWISPEILMLLSSIGTFILCRKITVGNTTDAEEGSEMDPTKKAKKRHFGLLIAIGRYVVLITLCLAAVLRPSVQGGLYFLIFLSTATWWSCYKQLRKGFAIFCRCIMVVVALHMSVLYTYQFQWIQEVLPPDSPYPRYFGLTPIFNVTCEGDPRIFHWVKNEVASYINPIALFWLYYILALESKALLKPQSQKKQGPFSRLEGSFTGSLSRQMSQRLSGRQLMRSGTTRHRWQSATRKVREKESTPTMNVGETTPLIRGVSPSNKQRYGSGKKSNSRQESGSSTGEHPEDIPLELLGKGTTEEEFSPTMFERAIFIMEYLLQVIIKSSYIATNIIMMAWSITYISWITFVLLLWANLLWLVPNQRKQMLRSSPFLVIYAWFLLISAYIYSMNLTEDELPSKIQGYNLAQIGFEKITYLPCNPLLVKCLFTAMFWITLRQFMQERIAARQSHALADMVAPLQISVGTATGISKEKEKGNKTMEKVGEYLKRFLTKFWIWVVAVTLFAVAITGQRMTGFRILYMALFLFFILTFQMSFRFWRRMMFAFWLTVIIYSMLILVMVYTYQFDNFENYWKDYLHVPIQQQLDIGLEKFQTKQLFVRLVTPTFFVIITVIQLHYFHKDFMELSDPKNITPITLEVDNSSLQGGAAVVDPDTEKDITSTTTTTKYDISECENIRKKRFQRVLKLFHRRFLRALDLLFLFLELHMPKVVLFFAMLLCVYDKCALYLIIIILISLSFTIGRSVQIFSIYSSSILVSVILLSRMIYQIQYIDDKMWNVTCEEPNGNSTKNVTLNDAQWLGFYKSDDNTHLPGLLKWNIIYIIVVAVWAVVLVRQFNYRAARGKPQTRAFFMFPKITRGEADKNLRNCIKYLFNYGFYKFGVEMSFMATVALIGFRMDFYAVIYSIWLVGLISLKRSTLSKIWIFYLFFVAIILPIQYFMVVGLPPSLCIEYPWNNSEILRRLQDWAFLLDAEFPPSPKKLICDFIVLLFVSRQSVVFRIEARYKGKDYAGGSNDSIIHLAEDKNFVNPVPDFITFVRSYLDIFKRGILMSFLWITLAIVFLAGTNRVNIFSIGYLIGAFVFLWQGSDLYLRPIPKILQAWNWLIGYNVVVILIKTVLQIIGCIFIQEIADNSCWIIQILGIGCVKKFGNVIVAAGLNDRDECKVPREFVGLVWDGICFGFLIMQKRIFQSYNFFHIIDEAKVTTILASRGAELIEELSVKRVLEKEDEERKILEKIKAKMDKIKATQQKIQGASYKDTTSHYVDKPPLARTSSVSSCASATSQQTSPAGYHTPIEEDDHPQLTPRSSLLQQQAPSPYSAVMTVSLEGYLDPQRISVNSPPNSELNPCPPSPDDSFPVFSPPPYDAAPPYAEAVSEPPVTTQRQTSIGPTWMAGSSFITTRQSVISYSSRSPISHHEYTIFTGRPKYRRRPPKSYKQAIRSGDYYMFDDLDDDDVDFELEVEKPGDAEDLGLQSKQPKISELLSTAAKTDVGTTLNYYGEDSTLRRRSSMPITRHRSYHSARSQLSAPLSAPPAVDIASKIDTILESPEPKPGTSKDEELSDISEPKDLTFWQKLLNILRFIWALVESCMTSLTLCLNRRSKDYRYVIKVLTKEKKILKEKTDYSAGIRVGSSQLWQPADTYTNLLSQSHEELVIPTPSAGTFSPSDSYRNALLNDERLAARSQNSDNDEKPPISEDSDTKAMATPLPYSSEQDRRKASVLTVPEIRILAPSLERGLDSPISSRDSQSYVPQFEDLDRTEMSSYDQPVIVRLLLAIWYTVMSNSQLLCYFIIFLTQIKSATFLSLPLPLMVFFWGSMTIPRPSKTFWITIIAYTEIIVLIKCMFQFDIIPWNRNQAVYSNPFYNPPAIIGIERTKNYAVYDLLLLLVVFFHRFMLKSLGLWKSSIIQTAVLSKGPYELDNNGKALVPVSASSPKRSSTTDENSDLKQLVEEGEDNLDEDTSVEESSKQLEYISGEQVGNFESVSQRLKESTSKYADAFRDFFKHLMDPNARVANDVYSYMFLCDFFNFFVILIGYSSFGTQQGDGGVSSYLEDNRVPVLFLLMLILQFMLIIIDRGIFLRKNIIAKIIFQFIQIVLLHVWLFVIFPIITERQFNSVLPPQIYYMVKCFYLLLSAYQIRCGYPTRILGNFLCKGYNYANMFLFKAFMMIPFLFELRTVMDWMWTDTSMTVFDWIKMEDIFAHIFQLKCSRHIEDEYPQPRGEKKKPLVKFLMGGGILAVIIGVIWFPLVFFSLGNAVGDPNVPYDITLQLRIGPYEPVYQMSAQSNSIYSFKQDDYNNLLNVYLQDKYAVSFISNYEPSDIAAIKLSTDSANIWSISPPDRVRMVKEVNSTNPVTVRLDYKVSHKTSNPEDSGVIPDNVEVILEAGTVEKPNAIRQNLLKMLTGNTSATSVLLHAIMPKFLKVTNRGTAKPIARLMNNIPEVNEKYNELRNITLALLRNETGGNPKEWWHIQETCDDQNYEDFLKNIPYNDKCQSIVMYTFNDKIFSASLNIITGGGIIGLYTTLVFVASRVLRGFFAEQCFKIMFEDLPNVDRVLQLCFDIYLVREAREFALEEDLFAKLVFLFRSPETLIKWTRPKEELGDDEDPEGDD